MTEDEHQVANVLLEKSFILKYFQTSFMIISFLMQLSFNLLGVFHHLSL